jgi:hypothetical protein
VLLDFHPPENKLQQGDEGKLEESNLGEFRSSSHGHQQATMGCLELYMFAEGSRHQEEIIVTGLEGRLEAYLSENMVFFYRWPDYIRWPDRTKPPPPQAIKEVIYDCSDLDEVYSFADEIPKHSGYHYCSTAVEWKHLIDSIKTKWSGAAFIPQVSLEDGIQAVEMGIEAMLCISKKSKAESSLKPIVACSTASSEHSLNLAIEVSVVGGVSAPISFDPKIPSLENIA